MLRQNLINQHYDPLSGATSIEAVCDAFWIMESDLRLLDWKAGDVAIWPLLRMKLYYDVARRLRLFDDPHPALNLRQRPPRFTRLIKRLGDTLGRWSPLAKVHDRPFAVIQGRLVEGRDLQTGALCFELKDRALIVASSPANQKQSQCALNYQALCKSYRKQHRHDRLEPVDASFDYCDSIRSYLLSRLGVEFNDLRQLSSFTLRQFRAERKGFIELFRRNGTKTLFLVDAYNRHSAVAAAHDAGARVVELQHGFISRYHLGYSWPAHDHIPYAPDEFWVFGQFWVDSTPLPKHIETRIVGAPYIQELARLAQAPREKKLVVFTSQGVIGKRLSLLAVETARRRPDLRIIYRLHPNELVADYDELCGHDVPANFSLSHRSPNIFALLAQAEVQVGVFSTTLLEGMALGARTLLVNLPGIEYMRPVIARGDAVLAQGLEDLVAKLDGAPLCRDASYYYGRIETRLV